MKGIWRIALFRNGSPYPGVAHPLASSGIWIERPPRNWVQILSKTADKGWVSPGFQGETDYWVMAEVDLKGWKS